MNSTSRSIDLPPDNSEFGAHCPVPRFVDRSLPDPGRPEFEMCDAIRYVQAVRQAAKEYPYELGYHEGFNSNACAAAIDRVIKKPDFNTLVCEEGGVIVGAVSYARPQVGTLEIGYLFRHKKAQSPAIGRLLLREGLRMTQAKDDSRVVLSVMPRNLKAISLYQSLGFTITSKCIDDPYIAISMELSGKENIQSAIATLTKQITEMHLRIST